MQTGNCYDSVLEKNLNMGLPRKVSFITEKNLKGKKPAEKGVNVVDDPNIPQDERENLLKFEQMWAE